MAELFYKTKTNGHERNHKRVYFSCHPDDFEKYFDIISGDLWATTDCAIFYSDYDNYKLSDIDDLLRDMQAFVMPITGSFLTENNVSKDIEFGFAVDNHIPIIPVVDNDELIPLFSTIMNNIKQGYGDIQLLNRESRDITELSYQEKLTKKIDDVIVGNDLIKRIQTAFDAYIFLSYRKKDRKHIKELISTIHSIPFCRDIALWYDEYLVPGEEWDEYIAKSLIKSISMVLAVTPSLIEEENYVSACEYPMAIAEKKEVIPVELIPTDREVLNTIFPGLPEMIKLGDTEKIEKYLKKLLKDIAVHTKGTDPEHEYLIGVAYLKGIDVEKNIKEGVDLIAKAAEEGYLEAIIRLANMYINGDCVEHDELKAIHWLDRAATIQEEIFNSTEDPKDGAYLFGIIENKIGILLARASLSIDRDEYINNVDKNIQKLFTIANRIKKDGGIEHYIIKSYLLKSTFIISNTFEGDYSKVIFYCDAVLAYINNNHLEMNEDVCIMMAHALVLKAMALSFLGMNKSAFVIANKAIETAKNIDFEKGDRFILSAIYLIFESIKENGTEEEIKDAINKMEKIIEQSSLQNNYHLMILSSMYRKYAELLYDNKEYLESTQFYEKGKDIIFSNLSKEYLDSSFLDEYYEISEVYCSSLLNLGRSKEAEEEYQKILTNYFVISEILPEFIFLIEDLVKQLIKDTKRLGFTDFYKRIIADSKEIIKSLEESQNLDCKYELISQWYYLIAKEGYDVKDRDRCFKKALNADRELDDVDPEIEIGSLFGLALLYKNTDINKAISWLVVSLDMALAIYFHVEQSERVEDYALEIYEILIHELHYSDQEKLSEFKQQITKLMTIRQKREKEIELRREYYDLFDKGDYEKALLKCVELYTSSQDIGDGVNLAFLLRLTNVKIDKYIGMDAINTILEEGIDARIPYAYINLILYAIQNNDYEKAYNIIENTDQGMWEEVAYSFWYPEMWEKRKTNEGAFVCFIAKKIGLCEFEDYEAIKTKVIGSEYADYLSYHTKRKHKEVNENINQLLGRGDDMTANMYNLLYNINI